MREFVKLIENILGLSWEAALTTTAGYFDFLKRIAIIFSIPFFALLIGLGFAVWTHNSGFSTFCIVALGSIMVLSYGAVFPLLMFFQWANRTFSAVQKVTGTFLMLGTLTLTFSFLVWRLDLASLPSYFVPMLLLYVAAMLFTVTMGITIDPATVRRELVVGGCALVTLALLGTVGVTTAFKQLLMTQGMLIERHLHNAAAPQLIAYNGNMLRCFDPIVPNKPQCFFAQHSDGSLVPYDRPGADPETGNPLVAATPEMVREFKKQQEVVASAPHQPIDPLLPLSQVSPEPELAPVEEPVVSEPPPTTLAPEPTKEQKRVQEFIEKPGKPISKYGRPDEYDVRTYPTPKPRPSPTQWEEPTTWPGRPFKIRKSLGEYRECEPLPYPYSWLGCKDHGKYPKPYQHTK